MSAIPSLCLVQAQKPKVMWQNPKILPGIACSRAGAGEGAEIHDSPAAMSSIAWAWVVTIHNSGWKVTVSVWGHMLPSSIIWSDICRISSALLNHTSEARKVQCNTFLGWHCTRFLPPCWQSSGAWGWCCYCWPAGVQRDRGKTAVFR